MEVGYKWVPPIWSECIQFLFCIIFELPFKKTNFVIFYLLKVRIHPAILKTVNNRAQIRILKLMWGGIFWKFDVKYKYIIGTFYLFMHNLYTSTSIPLFIWASCVQCIDWSYFIISWQKPCRDHYCPLFSYTSICTCQLPWF